MYSYMGHSYTKLLYHILFSTKERRPFIRREIRSRVHDYRGGTIRGLGGTSLQVGGIEEHVHALAIVPPTVAVSDFLSKLKSNTSQWMKQFCRDFEWQGGYTALTVSQSEVERLRRYIRNQEEHHRKMSFKEELARLLKAHRIKVSDETD